VDPDTVVLGGIYATLAPWLRGSFQAALRAGIPMTRATPPRIAISGLGPDAAARGAAGLVTARMLARPGGLLSASARAYHREMPKLFLGPLLRYVGETQATVWVETDAAPRVEVLVAPAGPGPAATPARAAAPTFQVERHHYA